MDIEQLEEQVKLNCTISDARFWGYYSICGLLLRLRELYRSEKNLMPWDAIPKEEITAWIADTEAKWKSLENESFRPLEIAGTSYDPFDVERLNAILNQEGLVYGGGYGRFNKPTFSLATLERTREVYDYLVYYSGREFCRDLTTSAAMLQGRCIFVRLDAVKNLLWDKLPEMQGKRCSGLLNEAFSSSGIEGTERGQDLSVKIDALASRVAELLVLHEIGEAFEDEYSDEWREILSGNVERSAEFYVRGVKDVLADTSEKGPLRNIVDGRDKTLLYFHIAFLDAIRKEIFPELMSAFLRFSDCGDWLLLEDARRVGYRRAEQLMQSILGLWQVGEPKKIVPFIKQTLAELPLQNCARKPTDLAVG